MTFVDERFGRFFDWATVGPVSRAAAASRDAHLARLDAADHPAATLRAEAGVIADARSLVARFLGATDHHIVFGRSVSALFSLVATSLSATTDRSTVVLTDTEHAVSRLCWTAVTPDLRIVVVPPAEDGTVDLDAVAAAVDERCLAVCAAHVARVSGVVQPVAELARIAHGVGAPLVVDGAQATGRVPVDVTDIDFYLGSGQKSLLAGSGLTFMAAHTDRLRPLTWSNANARLDGDTLTLADPPRRLEPEYPDLAGMHALRATVAEFLSVGMDKVHRHITDTTAVLCEAMDGLTPAHRPGGHNAGIVSYRSPVPADRLAARLYDDGFVVASVDGLLRVSVHLPNSAGDVLDLARAVSRHL